MLSSRSRRNLWLKALMSSEVRWKCFWKDNILVRVLIIGGQAYCWIRWIAGFWGLNSLWKRHFEGKLPWMRLCWYLFLLQSSRKSDVDFFTSAYWLKIIMLSSVYPYAIKQLYDSSIFYSLELIFRLNRINLIKQIGCWNSLPITECLRKEPLKIKPLKMIFPTEFSLVMRLIFCFLGST